MSSPVSPPVVKPPLKIASDSDADGAEVSSPFSFSFAFAATKERFLV